MCARGSKSGIKNETPKLPETRESLGKIGIFLLLKYGFPIFFKGFLLSSTAFQFSTTAFRFSSTAFHFLPWLSAFFNGFPIFLKGFPLSEKFEKIYLRRQVYERSLFELRISRHSLPELRNSR
jgi:hypothetical protein